MKDLELQMTLLMPVMKLDKTRCLIGGDIKEMKLAANQPMVRIGGGFEPLDIYLKKHGLSHCIRLNRMLEESLLPLKDTVLKVLEDNHVGEGNISRFQKLCTRD